MKKVKPVEAVYISSGEIVELMEKAKALGVLELRIQGLEFRFDDGSREANEQFVPSPRAFGHGQMMVPPSREPRPVCDDCGSEKIPSKRGRGFYCVECYIAKKERRYE